MENNTHPTLSNGKICYIEMPAIDINASASHVQAELSTSLSEGLYACKTIRGQHDCYC
ncbi:MAG: hypothetical protein ABI923_02435 [bacterium]